MRSSGFAGRVCSIDLGPSDRISWLLAQSRRRHIMNHWQRSIGGAWLWTFGTILGGLCGVEAAVQPPVEQVAAYGRVSPGERPVKLTAPYYLKVPLVVAELFVKEGDYVTRHQKLAVMQSQ